MCQAWFPSLMPISNILTLPSLDWPPFFPVHNRWSTSPWGVQRGRAFNCPPVYPAAKIIVVCPLHFGRDPQRHDPNHRVSHQDCRIRIFRGRHQSTSILCCVRPSKVLLSRLLPKSNERSFWRYQIARASALTKERSLQKLPWRMPRRDDITSCSHQRSPNPRASGKGSPSRKGPPP